MKLGIMQPYFFPYIGYFQLIKAVDKYVIYDNIQYTKKGWINRNRILQNNSDVFITISLEKDSDYLDIKERKISLEFNKSKLLNQIRNNYRKAPYCGDIMPLVERIVNYEENNLFLYLLNSVKQICHHLNIHTEFIVSSTVDIDHSLKGQDKVITFCDFFKATDYYNAIGGQELYSLDIFRSKGINLHFLKTGNIHYKQFDAEFIPYLSIIDVMMFNSPEEINKMLNNYELV